MGVFKFMRLAQDLFWLFDSVTVCDGSLMCGPWRSDNAMGLWWWLCHRMASPTQPCWRFKPFEFESNWIAFLLLWNRNWWLPACYNFGLLVRRSHRRSLACAASYQHLSWPWAMIALKQRRYKTRNTNGKGQKDNNNLELKKEKYILNLNTVDSQCDSFITRNMKARNKTEEKYRVWGTTLCTYIM